MSDAPCASPFEGRVIFVLGSRRTGTTWLQELLLAHPAVVAVPTVEVEPGRLDPQETVIMGALEAVWLSAHNADSGTPPGRNRHQCGMDRLVRWREQTGAAVRLLE